ncbi:MAG: hypothetical protein HYT11_02965 [Candidatus Levybacteria bacterium]|nr:hypothetical protein [Candidatus Levybacteria bacterium]
MPQEREAIIGLFSADHTIGCSPTKQLLKTYWEEGDRPLETDEMYESGHELLNFFGLAFGNNLEYLKAAGNIPTAMMPQEALQKRKGVKEEVSFEINGDRFLVSSHADMRHREVMYHWEGIDPRTRKSAFETLEIDVPWPEVSYSARMRYEHGYGERGAGHVENINTLSAIDNAIRFYLRTTHIFSKGTSITSLIQNKLLREHDLF